MSQCAYRRSGNLAFRAVGVYLNLAGSPHPLYNCPSILQCARDPLWEHPIFALPSTPNRNLYFPPSPFTGVGRGG